MTHLELKEDIRAIRIKLDELGTPYPSLPLNSERVMLKHYYRTLRILLIDARILARTQALELMNFS